VSWGAPPGACPTAGQPVAVLEAMKMQHVVAAPVAGVLRSLAAAVGETVDEGAPLAFIEPGEQSDHALVAEEIDLELIRPDLAEVRARVALTLDDARPDAVTRRRRTNQRTARENLDDLFDEGTFKEFGGLAIAAQKRRRTVEDLQANTPADGIVTGVGEVGGVRCVALAYDFTVLAGTQGHFSHKKTDRILEFAEHWKLPVVWYTEGGGGRPGDTDQVAGMDVTTFAMWGALAGVVPRIAVNNGYCFAGNAALFGCADITVATRQSWIGMAGPAMIEGGGMGVYPPTAIGPVEVQTTTGVIDVLAEDERDATRLARQLLGYFQGPIDVWCCADQNLLWELMPADRRYTYDVRRIITILADTGSFIEIRPHHGKTVITGLLRIEGKPFGLICNDCRVLGGAIDTQGSASAARFLKLCDDFALPVLSLVDTPGFMVGPESETEGAVRIMADLFTAGARLRSPLVAIFLRKGYGLGAIAMTGGSFSRPIYSAAWPTGEFGAMGLEGAVHLGFKKELDAAANEAEREALFARLIGALYDRGKATEAATHLEIDAVIEPKDTRQVILRAVGAAQKN